MYHADEALGERGGQNVLEFILGALWLIFMVFAILVILKVPALRNRARFIAGVLWLILMVFIILVFLNTPGIR